MINIKKSFRLHLCKKGKNLLANKCPGYVTKQSDGNTAVMLELLRIWSTPLFPSLPGPLWPEVGAHERVLSVGQIEPFDIYNVCKQMMDDKLSCLK